MNVLFVELRRGLAAAGLVLALLIFVEPLPGGDLVGLGRGSTWKYLDTGSAPTGWSQVGFDDSRWKSGPAPLGYGTTRLNAEVRPAGPGPKPTTAWFRREFIAPTATPGERIVLLLCVDDAAVA